jgi:hypothetical protein
MLPRELWIIILEIKWWTARKNRLVEILRFPKQRGNNVFIVGRQSFRVGRCSFNYIDWFYYVDWFYCRPSLQGPEVLCLHHYYSRE